MSLFESNLSSPNHSYVKMLLGDDNFRTLIHPSAATQLARQPQAIAGSSATATTTGAGSVAPQTSVPPLGPGNANAQAGQKRPVENEELDADGRPNKVVIVID